ncbi:MAG: hypothetical protein M1813_005426 [Trichoglossum hirsutum]|nr:MAG: hypothetical protein M1813_005426 [Trichoglossum hirsutum]
MYSSACFRYAATVSLRPLCGFSTAYRVVGGCRPKAVAAQKRTVAPFTNGPSIPAILHDLEEHMDDWEGRITDNQCSIFKLRDRVDALEAVNEGRPQQSPDTSQRDSLYDSSAIRTQVIDDPAKRGDAVADATLYQSGARTDTFLMNIIYGLSYHDVLSLARAGDEASIDILNARATLKSEKDKGIQRIEDAWIAYVIQLKQNWGEFPTKNPQSALGQAYLRFWKAYEQHEKSRNGKGRNKGVGTGEE